MAKQLVRNFFKPNANQINCESVGKTLDGLEMWTVDQGQGVGVLYNKMVYRICANRPEYIETLKKTKLIEHIQTNIGKVIHQITGEGSKSTFLGASPAEFELAGFTDKWRELKAICDKRIADEATRKDEIQAAKDQAQALANAAELDKAQEDFRVGKSITAEQFEELCKRHSVKLPMKTIGWVRKALIQICQTGYSYNTAYNRSSTIMQYAGILAYHVTEKPEEPCDPEVEKLFQM